MSHQHVILMGPPGAGKGTQAAVIVRDYHLEHLSTGDVFRREVDNKTPLGVQASAFMNRGELVPDRIVIEMVLAVIKKGTEKKGYLFDGFPRSLVQAQALDEALNKMQQPIFKVINLEVPEKVLLDRIALRADTDAPRTDDKQEVFKARLKVYDTATKPLLDYYKKQNKLVVINGHQTREQVAQALKSALGPKSSSPV